MNRPCLPRPSFLAAPLVTLVVATSCSSAYYKAMETFGWAKRDILVDRVQDGRKDQEQAKEKIQETYKSFQELTGQGGGDLEVIYKRLSKDLMRAQDAAADVKSSINKIEGVAQAMFSEWATELDDFKSAELRSKSERLLRDTKQRYGKMLGAMRDAEGRMTPILDKFSDHVRFLKHNLNAKSVADLQTTVDQIGGDVSRLIEEMEMSIREADEFIKSMDASS